MPTSSFRRCSVAAGTTSFWVMMAVLQCRTALATARLRHRRHRFSHHVACVFGVLQQHGDNLVHANVIVFLVPAIVIRNHGDGDVAQLGFAGQSGLREVGHADHVHAPTAIQIGLSFGRELRPFHVEVGAAPLHIHAGATASALKHYRLFLTNWMSKPNVRDKSVAEERVDTVARAIDKLIRNDKVERSMLFLQRADGRQRNDPRDPKLLQPVNVGAVIYLRRHEAMSPTMARQESYISTRQCAQHVGIGRRSKRRFQRHLANVG